jgi:myosin-5
MIEKKLGIMDVLEAETRSPVGTDKSLIIRFNERFANNEHKFFAKGRFGETDFVIKHYALDINYQIEGFIEKNKDNVTDDQYELLSNSSFPFLKEILFEEQIIEELSTSSALLGSAQGQPKPNKKTSLGSIFKGSLIKLMATLDKTNPHFIRCIKPNQSKSPFKFEPPNVLSQLVACGVLETIRISRAGFPSKEIYSVFVDRYHFLVHSEYWKDDPKKLTENICKTYLKDDNKFALGLSKVFFRAGQIAKLEKIRTENYNRKLQTIKKNTMIYYHKVKYDRAIVNPKLQTEIVNSLVSKLIVPLQDNKKVLNKQEIVFSAHLIGSMLFEFLQSTINVPEFFKRVLKGI